MVKLNYVRDKKFPYDNPESCHHKNLYFNGEEITDTRYHTYDRLKSVYVNENFIPTIYKGLPYG